MLEQLQNVKRGVADVVTSKKRIELQQQKLEQNVVKLETQARQAVAANREDLARQALERKAIAQQQLQDMDGQVQQLDDQQEKLVAAQQQLETRIESFRSQKEILKAQYSAAEAQVKVGEAATGIGQHMKDTGLAIQRAKDKTEEMQARASAIDELTSTGALEDFTAGDQTQLDRELAQISSASQVDDELAKLKAEVGSGAPQKEIAAGDAEPAPARSPPAETAGGSAGRGNHRVLTRFGDILFGRKKLQEPAAEKLFALSTAAVTLDTECSLKTAGDAALIFKPLSAGEFTSTETDAEELLRSVARDSGSTIDRKTDSFGFEWVIVRDAQLEDQVAGVHTLASELEQHGFGGQLLAAAFRFDGSAFGTGHPVYWIYGFKTGTWWPFVPTGEKQERDNAQELELKAKLEEELPIEPDLSKWLALFDAPI